MSVLPMRRSVPEQGPVHVSGKVMERQEDGAWLVDCADGVRRAGWRAASCLLAPAPGDVVLLSGTAPEAVYLIAVLELADPAVSRIEVDGALSLHAAGGAVTLDSAGAVRLRAGQAMEMQAPRLSLQADAACCDIDELRYTGRAVRATAGLVRLVGRACEAVVDRYVLMARTSLRMVDDTDQLRARHVDCQAEQGLRLHGRHALVTAKELVKVDGEQIHMG